MRLSAKWGTKQKNRNEEKVTIIKLEFIRGTMEIPGEKPYNVGAGAWAIDSRGNIFIDKISNFTEVEEIYP